ncbi:MAG TPA: aminotransferase class V-fold PLP-dependent enzyme [Alphaproteobacteria bacterium]|jgi:cysteine desulfurase|nr:aminotransferase class V-fold PLP-dependent enzyme [Alphaproteobacteria bacterium]
MGIYLDHHATTPLDPRAYDAMKPWLTERFGNPHSESHMLGRSAAEAVESARAQVAALIGADPREIIFTSGATEANNLAIIGAARFLKGTKHRVVTIATEHKCVLESARSLEDEGFEVVTVGVQPNGLVDMAALDRAITDDTAVVTVMAANNEIGVLQPLAEIAGLARSRGALVHSDAAQAAGKIPLDVTNVDTMSISSHKMYGPMGVGALYVRRRPRVRLQPLFHGGGQERGLRSGTLPVALCVGFGAACAVAREDLAAEAERVARLRDRLASRITAAIPGARINGAGAPRLPGNLNIALPGVDAIQLIEAVPEVALSAGSACTSAEVAPSYVLMALGLDEATARASLRFGVGRFNTEADIDRAGALIAAAAQRLKGEARVA